MTLSANPRFREWCRDYLTHLPATVVTAAHKTMLFHEIERGNIQALAADPALAFPVVIVAGGCKDTGLGQRINHLLSRGLATRKHRLYISGGTRSGVCAAVATAREQSRHVYLIGFCPRRNPDGTVSPYHVPVDPGYDAIDYSPGEDFSVKEVDRYWQFLEEELAISPALILMIGAGGGELSKFEYHRARDKGAKLLLIQGSGRTADEVLAEYSGKRSKSVLRLAIDREPRELQKKLGKLCL